MTSLLKLISRLWTGRGLHAEPPACLPARLVFERFRQVLLCNNQALEIIAEMGEKLGGAFIFDRRYIQVSVERLSATVRASIDALNTLDANHHLALYPVYDRLTAELQALLSGQEERTGPPLLQLGALQPRHWGLAGGKFSHLAEICGDDQLKVPPGFVITIRTFHDYIEANGLREPLSRFESLLQEPGGPEEAIEGARRRLEAAVARGEPPAGLLDLLAGALAELKSKDAAPLFLAVRSSAPEEDMDFSFAGLYRTVLNVAAEPARLFLAYRRVVASLFGERAIRYRRHVLPEGGPLAIAVGCQQMIDARASGVAFSLNPLQPENDTLEIVGAWGLGIAVVEGSAPADFFYLRRTSPHLVLSRQVARKESGRFPAPAGGLEVRLVPPGEQQLPCLTPVQLEKLAGVVLHLETLFKRPVDVEWAFDQSGELFIAQTRPLLIQRPEAHSQALPGALRSYELLSSGQGKIAQQGIGAGPVCLVSGARELQDFPEGAVLVGRSDSASYARVMHRAAAIVTEIGTPVSHMATLCRELRVPCLVGVAGIRHKVRQGMEITVDAEDRRIYRGRVPELTAYQTSSLDLAASQDFRLLRRAVKTVSRLHLLDPLLQEFTPRECRTYHDILRYTHEMAVARLVELGRDERCLLREHLVRRMDLPIPAGILVLDLDGGLKPEAPLENVPFSAVASIPFRAILQGLLFPEVWHRATMPVGFKDLVSSMTSGPPSLSRQYSGHNIAVVSRDYVNLCFRFGYHFNIIDAHCHEVERDNHIYFRFLGGATDLTKRSRRARLIAQILEAFDFKVRTRGDVVTARAGNMVQSEMERTLDILGRLVGFTRQLDVRLESEELVDYFTEAFLQGNYEAVSN